jgi:diguanylate cyclase (GGDEF)-like protein
MYLALHDSLTKLPNRVLLDDRLQQAIQKAKREHTSFALMFLDLDGFKVVNDAFGHHIGDLLLIAAAQCIQANIRACDTLARIGGDEFILLTEMAEPMDVASLADKLVMALRQPFDIGGHELRLSASIGIAIYDGRTDDPHDLLRNADAAMYHAKGLGRNGYCFFESSMNADAHAQMQLLHDLRLAVERGELVLHYQPKFDAVTLEIIGVEALLRWMHPIRGLVSPDQFIPLAEKTGLIVPIGEWALDEACRQMRQWRNQGIPDCTVAVNLSSLQFRDAGLVRMVRETLERHDLEPRCLILEITESTAMRDADESLTILQQLRDMGVQISIDDFGTGYSSLLYLKRLPASELKIDRGFVQDLTRDTEDAAIVSAIVALGKSLNLRIVAEGVETLAQQEFLTSLGCYSLQGYLLGRPTTAEQLFATAPQGVVTVDNSGAGIQHAGMNPRLD